MSEPMTNKHLVAIKQNIVDRFEAGDKFPRADMLCLVAEVERLTEKLRELEHDLIPAILDPEYMAKLSASDSVMAMAKEIKGNRSTIATLTESLGRAVELAKSVERFWGDHGAWGDFASLTSAAGAFRHVADRARQFLASLSPKEPKEQ